MFEPITISADVHCPVQGVVRIARRHGLVVPLLLLLETCRPLAGLGYSCSIVAEPMLSVFFGRARMLRLLEFLERPNNLDDLIHALEQERYARD